MLTAVPARGDGRLQVVSLKPSNGEAAELRGRILIEAQDGGVLLEDRAGALWTVTAEQLAERRTTEEDFRPCTPVEMGRQLQAEFGEGFHITATRHYVICSNASRPYAQWCGALFERLFGAFHGHWQRDKLPLQEPVFPLSAVVFADQKQFAAYAAADAGTATADAKGYYSLRTNRMVLYDLTSEFGGRPPASAAEINERLAAGAFNVATVVHEATHQIAFNTGLHTRYADNPLWLTEGLAMYFETPDLASRTGWRTAGQINRPRARQFQNLLSKKREAEALAGLIASDDRFRDSSRAGDAYAEAWALTYFLLKTRRVEYVAYLNRLAAKPPLVWDTPEERLADFRAAFGEDLEALDREFVRYAARLR